MRVRSKVGGGETHLARTRRARKIHRTLERTYPDAHCELNYEGPFELLVAVILSARCTDEQVNKVTPALFTRFPTPDAMAAADLVDLEDLIRSTGFFRAKASNLIGVSQRLCEEFAGRVPRTMADLTSLPGVGRKSANVVLGEVFGVPGIAVDTHVMRLSRRLGLSAEEDPNRIELDLTDLFPPGDWISVSHVLIRHGRRRCRARVPACGACPVSKWCPSAGLGPLDPVEAARLVKDGPADEAETPR